jgi:predicted SnoaL-like aldol condensation-catalyzing enzyme
MSSTEETSLEERNKTLIRSFIEEIFNKHNLSSIEKYFGNDFVEGNPQAGSGSEGFKTVFNRLH